MVSILADFFTSFLLGLLTPLTAVCVLPLYPGFLAFLSNKLSGKESDKTFILFGVVITLGVILFMFLLGLIFTTFLQISLNKVIGIVSPIAFGILGIISIFLILNVDIGRFLPKFNAPVFNSPILSAFVFGFFFGAIVIPCNPLFIAAMLTRSVATTSFITNIFNFIFFGIGIGTPLLLFSIISTTSTKTIINFLIRNKRIINFLAGISMLIISIYYLIFVFRILG